MRPIRGPFSYLAGRTLRSLMLLHLNRELGRHSFLPRDVFRHRKQVRCWNCDDLISTHWERMTVSDNLHCKKPEDEGVPKRIILRYAHCERCDLLLWSSGFFEKAVNRAIRQSIPVPYTKGKQITFARPRTPE